MNTSTIVEKIIADHGLKRRGKLYVGPCPECGGSSSSDKFNIRMDGGFKCYACAFNGDIITWLRKRENMSCPDAHDHAGRECRIKEGCAAYDNCRLGRGGASPKQSKPRGYRPPVRPYQPKQNTATVIPTVTPSYPKAVWSSWADDLIAKAHEKLLKNQEQLDYLASRGIDSAGVSRFSLGWLDHQLQVVKKDIGLPIEADGKDKLWVPEGLLIPIFDTGGAIHRIRVRRPLSARDKFLPTLKYVWLKGSGNMPMTIEPSGEMRGAVVVEAELDAMLIALAHPDVLVVALGSLTSGVDQELFSRLNEAAVILVALDTEQNSRQAIENWQYTFRHAKFLATPEGKDAGDYYTKGGDIHAWLEKGLPSALGRTVFHPSLPPLPPMQDAAFSPGRKLNGGRGGEEKSEEKKGEGIEVVSEVAIEVTLSNGKIIYLVESRGEEWDRLSGQGLPVFTRMEIAKLKAATATMTKEEAIKAAMAAIEVKEVFGGHINSGKSTNN